MHYNACSDASFGYPGGPILFKNLNFGIDLDSRIASKIFPSCLMPVLLNYDRTVMLGDSTVSVVAPMIIVDVNILNYLTIGDCV